MTLDFSKYILQFVKNTEKHQTHLSFNKGKYNVPDEKYEEFYKYYYESMKSNDNLYLIEKITNSKFAFFIDIDLPKQNKIVLTDDDVCDIVNVCNQEIDKMIDNNNENVNIKDYIISKRNDKYHINYRNLIVDNNIAKILCDNIIKNIKQELQTSIDTSVYRTGLRLLGSKKATKSKKEKQEENEIYNIYDLVTKKYIKNNELSFEMFMKSVIRVKQNTELSKVKDEFVNTKVTSSENKVVIKGVKNNQVINEICVLLNDIKLINDAVKDFDMTIESCRTKQNKIGMHCYYITVKHSHCPFKNRQHKRESNPIYIELNMTGIYIKCHDSDCIGRIYPEKGIDLPKDFEIKYPNLYLSISTKYWKTDFKITDEIRKYLEESLSGSHYQIAKTVFQIYKDRFRVDDVKNTTWYEFDGIRWNISHVINILISEELPKYYRGIKISDTSHIKETTDLNAFLTNEEKTNVNIRNQMVDKLIASLENVSFKNNIINQITYLFKNYDTDFYNKLDSNPHLVGFKNGVYDFSENVFRKSNQDDCITFSTGYDYIEYDENYEEIQEIYEFLSKIIPNTRVREYTLKVLGKALVGIPDEKFYIWTGLSGANGKSTLVNFLESTLGDYATSVDVSLLTNKRSASGNASPDVVRLRGKRLFTFQEPEHDDKLRTGILKQYTGGDTIIARELFKAPISFKLQGTMIMCCNDLPTVTSADGGTWRRIRVVEFKSRFCDNPVKENEFRIDPTIKTKIKNWRPYFMSILIHWYNKSLYEGLNEPDEVKKATNKYKVENDKFNEFFDQCLEESESFENNKTIYGNFQNWWMSNYPNSKIPDIRELRRAMKIKYGNELEQNVNGVIQYGFKIKIKYTMDENINEDDDY